jgi:hypothetical protein
MTALRKGILRLLSEPIEEEMATALEPMPRFVAAYSTRTGKFKIHAEGCPNAQRRGINVWSLKADDIESARMEVLWEEGKTERAWDKPAVCRCAMEAE